MILMDPVQALQHRESHVYMIVFDLPVLSNMGGERCRGGMVTVLAKGVHLIKGDGGEGECNRHLTGEWMQRQQGH